jgi:iron complex outermembrane receptor protein
MPDVQGSPCGDSHGDDKGTTEIVSMNKGSSRSLVGRVSLAAAIAAASASGSAAAVAAEVEEFEGVVEEVVSLGTRREARAAVDTAVPVDVFGSEALESVSSADMVEVMSTLVPSFQVGRQPISDGATFIRTPELRGLDAHHTLVLVNGKRRHRASLVRLGGFGDHGPDIGSIPTIALRSVEVLRDGAAAQYGSDAIAGVLNFNLKNNRSGGDLRVKIGEYDENDGEETTIEGNIGLPLGDSGFISLSGQYAQIDPTSRSRPYDIPAGGGLPSDFRVASETPPLDALGRPLYGPDVFTNAYDAAGNLVQSDAGSDGLPDDLGPFFSENFSTIGGSSPFDFPEQIWGQPDQEQALVFVNAAMPVSEAAEVYAFGNYSTKEVTGGFFHRRASVDQLLPVRLETGRIYTPRSPALYPSGFTPQFGGDVTDYSVVGGLRGEFGSGLSYDVSANYGYNEIEYAIENTMNPSMGPATPTAFEPGDLVNEELSIVAAFTYPVEIDAFASPLTIGFGAEYREEGYEIQEGDPDSYRVGPYARTDPWNFDVTAEELAADPSLGVVGCRIPGEVTPGVACDPGDPIFNAVPFGSNGFPGYDPSQVTDEERDSMAVYVDFEADVTEDWLVNLAGRYEDYSDFGDVFIAKGATRYALTENLNVRGSIGTGFRAPTVGQSFTRNVSTRIEAGGPVAALTAPPTSPEAQVFGASALDAEDSFSYTFGVAATPLDGLSLTVDYYWIEITDRIVLSSDFVVGEIDGALQDLVDAGVQNPEQIFQVAFFNNDVDTETSGVDIVGTYEFATDLGSSSVSLALNYNDTEITEEGRFLNEEDRRDAENFSPNWQGNVTARHSWNQLDLMVRGRYYGEYENFDAGLTQEFDRELMVDLEGRWNFMTNYSVTLGARNLFDNFPERGKLGPSDTGFSAFDDCCGQVYNAGTIVPWQGRFVYLQASANF